MRRRPEEDDQEQEQRRQAQVARRRRPADERRDRAGGAADHDVLRRRPLQPARVDEHVEEAADEREHRGQHVHERGQQHERERHQREAELDGALGRDALLGDRAVSRAAHQPVEIAVEHVVERARAAAREREAGHRDREQAERRHAFGADEHSRGAGQQQQGHDPRLGQRDVVAPGRGRDGLAAEGLGRDHERRRQREAGERKVRGLRDHECRRQERDQRGQRGHEQPAVLDPGCGHERRQRRQGQRGETAVGGAELERPAHDRGATGGGREQRGQPQPGTGARLRHGPPRSACAGRAAAARWSRREPCRSCAPAAASSCTTRACRPATGR